MYSFLKSLLDPTVILLDEPAAGMNPAETMDLVGLIERIRARGITVLLIEHRMKLVMGISSHIVVLHQGRLLAEGPPDDIRTHDEVRRVYLGNAI